MTFYKLIQFILIVYVGLFLGGFYAPLFLAAMLAWMALQSKYKLHALIVAVIFFLINITNMQSYTFLPQAQQFVDQELTDVIASEHFHILRFLVSYPAVILSESLNVDLDKAYTYCGGMYIVGSLIILLSWIYELPTIKRSSALIRFYTIIMPVFIALAIIINGRIAPPYFGMVVLLYQQVKALEEKRVNLWFIAGHFLAAFLSTVSSGTFVIVFGQALVGCGLLLLRCDWKERTKIFACIAFLGLFTPYLLAGVEKNLSYFDNSIINMLRHGFGSVVHRIDIEVLALFFLPGTIVLFFLWYGSYRFYKSVPTLTPVLFSIMLGAAGGVFGLLTGTMALPGVFVSILLLGLYRSSERKKMLLNNKGEKECTQCI